MQRNGTAVMELPRCPNPDHGHMDLCGPEGQTPEQRWCGTWYRCSRCQNAALLVSPELKASLAA